MSLEIALQRMWFSPWGKHWWALHFWAWEPVVTGQLIRMPGASQNGKGRKCAVRLRDCLVLGSHDAFEMFTARAVWATREFAGGWEVGAIAWGSLKYSPIVDELGNSNFDLKTSFYIECLFSLLSQTSAERSRNILHGNAC